MGWTASPSLVAGYRVHYGASSGHYTANEDAGNTTEYAVDNLAEGATYYFAVTAYDSAGKHSGFTNEVSATIAAAPPSSGGALPAPWLGMDIGNVGVAGSAGYSEGVYTLQGSGADIWGTADAFHFAYQALDGDGGVVARVASLTNTSGWAKAGVMIRENLDANARHAMVAVTPGNGVAFQHRATTGGSSAHTAGAAVAAPYWVKLTRAGDRFTAYQSADGAAWTRIGEAVTLSMGPSVYVGLAVSSNDNGALNTATLDQVNVSTDGDGDGGTDPDPPPSPVLELTATGHKARGLQKADLVWWWLNTTSTSVDVYRDNMKVATTPNTGTFTDHINLRGSGTYTYRVCEAGTNDCSNESTVVF